MRLLRLCLILVLLTGSAWAALNFPPLTGRVVDDAHILSPTTVQKLDQLLGDYERGTTNQVVVATVPDLGGTSIEDYGYQLGRFWQIGQKGKDNGIILLVAPNERRVRIEVGYGLEPVLTDATSSTIIQGIILPQFKAGRMEQGIVDGTEAILSVLGGKGVPPVAQTGSPVGSFWFFVLLMAFFWFASRHPFLAAFLLFNNSSRFGGRSSGGGGFRGGGGSFGGGGASGSW